MTPANAVYHVFWIKASAKCHKSVSSLIFGDDMSPPVYESSLKVNVFAFFQDEIIMFSCQSLAYIK